MMQDFIHKHYKKFEYGGIKMKKLFALSLMIAIITNSVSYSFAAAEESVEDVVNDQFSGCIYRKWF